MKLTDRYCQSVPLDVAKDLGFAGILKLLQLMSDAYLDLKCRQCVTASSHEDSITEEWFIHIQERWSSDPSISYCPIPQKQDYTKAKARGKPPTIDFCFRNRFDARSYFGAECKLLDEGNNTHLAEYLHDKKGIGRFLNGKYAANASVGAMVGYVRVGDCEVVAQSLSEGISELPEKPVLKKSISLREFDSLYESSHKRSFLMIEFRCFHFLFGFGCSNN